MEFMLIKDKKGDIHYINPDHISAICEVDGRCKINLMGHDYMITNETMKEVQMHLISFKY